jgi:hypothetical protein
MLPQALAQVSAEGLAEGLAEALAGVSARAWAMAWDGVLVWEWVLVLVWVLVFGQSAAVASMVWAWVSGRTLLSSLMIRWGCCLVAPFETVGKSSSGPLVRKFHGSR